MTLQCYEIMLPWDSRTDVVKWNTSSYVSPGLHVQLRKSSAKIRRSTEQSTNYCYNDSKKSRTYIILKITAGTATSGRLLSPSHTWEVLWLFLEELLWDRNINKSDRACLASAKLWVQHTVPKTKNDIVQNSSDLDSQDHSLKNKMFLWHCKISTNQNIQRNTINFI